MSFLRIFWRWNLTLTPTEAAVLIFIYPHIWAAVNIFMDTVRKYISFPSSRQGGTFLSYGHCARFRATPHTLKKITICVDHIPIDTIGFFVVFHFLVWGEACDTDSSYLAVTGWAKSSWIICFETNHRSLWTLFPYPPYLSASLHYTALYSAILCYGTLPLFF